MKYYCKLIFFITVFTISEISYGQLEGEWIHSYSFQINGNNEIDKSEKNLEHKSIININKDTIMTLFSESWRKNTKNNYTINGNDLLIKAENKEFTYKVSFLKHSQLNIVDSIYKGNYAVFRKLNAPKEKYNLEEIKKKLLSIEYKLNFSKIFKPRIKNVTTSNEYIKFNDNMTVSSKRESAKRWSLLETKRNVFLIIDNIIFQVFNVKKKSIVLKSFYIRENTFKLCMLEDLNNNQ